VTTDIPIDISERIIRIQSETTGISTVIPITA